MFTYHIGRHSFVGNSILTRDVFKRVVFFQRSLLFTLYRCNPDEKRPDEFPVHAGNVLSASCLENVEKNNKFKMKIKNILMNNTKRPFQFREIKQFRFVRTE